MNFCSVSVVKNFLYFWSAYIEKCINFVVVNNTSKLWHLLSNSDTVLRIPLWYRCRYASFWEYLQMMHWILKNVVSYKCWDSWYSANYEDDFHHNSSQWSRTIVEDCRMFHVIYKIQHMTCSEFLMYDYTAWILVDFWKFYFA